MVFPIRDMMVLVAVIFGLVVLNNPKILTKFIPKSLPNREEEKPEVEEWVEEDPPPKKLNPITLSQEDYDEIRANQDYWKCEYCGAINYRTHSTCPYCGGVRREM